MPMPSSPKIYHIVHVDRLASIIADGFLWCDAEMQRKSRQGTSIGMSTIKERRLRNRLSSCTDLYVGGCVLFYFCPRSVMLYVIYKRNHPDLTYRGGQQPIVHLVADLQEVVAWAGQNNRQWAFTLSNAGSRYFDDHCDLDQLNKINWEAVEARQWRTCQEEKQAEFLVEHEFPWTLIQHIGVHSEGARDKVQSALVKAPYKPPIQIQQRWYY